MEQTESRTTNGNGKTPAERAATLTEYNPFASIASDATGGDVTNGLLAVAYELSKLRAELHFSRKGRSS